jgi:hypothetical protein
MELALKLLKNRYAQLILALIAGTVVGLTLYPTKTVTEKTRIEVTKTLSEEYEAKLTELKTKNQQELSEVSSELREHKELAETLTKKVDTLVTENRSLKESKKVQKFKLIKPDGTVVEKEIEESNKQEETSIVTQVREEFTKKVASIEDKWKTAFEKRLVAIKEEHKKELEEAKSKKEVVVEEKIVEKEVVVNPKQFGVDAAVYTDLTFGVSASYDVFKPFYLRTEYEFSKESAFEKVGVGIGIKF